MYGVIIGSSHRYIARQTSDTHETRLQGSMEMAAGERNLCWYQLLPAPVLLKKKTTVWS